jgi:hypothetical protein
MDPNANLAELRQWASRVLASRRNTDPCRSADPCHDETTDRAAELFVALDAWLRAGGFPPDDWYVVLP